MKDSRKKMDSNVGIFFSIVGIIASIFVIIINILNNESIGVGIGLVIFCFLSLLKNIKKEKSNKWYKL